MILVACTGIFLPLEVALNQAWGVTKSRNYLHNQVIAFGLAILMVVLGMGSILVNAAARDVLTVVSSFTARISSSLILFCTLLIQGTSFLLLAATTGVASILFFFSIYWLLPNRKVPWRPVLQHLDLLPALSGWWQSISLWPCFRICIWMTSTDRSMSRWGCCSGPMFRD